MLKIVIWGDSVLRAKSSPVALVTPELRAVAEEMLKTMYKANGVGLAAQQVGRTERLCVIDVPKECEKKEYQESNAQAVAMPMVLFNPEILDRAGEQTDSEGCLSFPKIHTPITRSDKVTVTYLDQHGMRQTVTVQGLLARAVQHELDHLDGVVFTDLVPEEKKPAIQKKLDKLARKGK